MSKLSALKVLIFLSCYGAMMLIAGCDSREGRAILSKAAERCESVRGATYFAVYTNTYYSDRQPVLLKGMVKIQRHDTGRSANVSMSVVQGGDAIQYVYNGSNLWMLKPLQQSVTVVDDTAFAERFFAKSELGALLETPLMTPVPFADELGKDAEYELLGVESVGDLPCYVVEVRYPDDKIFADYHTRWYIDTSGYLPYKYEMSYIYEKNRHNSSLEILNLNVNPLLAPEEFTPSIPPEYEISHFEPPALPPAPEIGAAAPDFTLENAYGEEVTLASFRGRLVVLDFWGTWCLPCVKAMPALQSIHQRYSERNVAVLGISCREAPDADPASFMRDKGFDYQVLLDGDEVASHYGVTSFPTVYVIGADGTVAFRHVGATDDIETRLTIAIEDRLAVQSP